MDDILIKRLKEFISSSEALISEEAMDEITHFLTHGEYEMAYEGLLIELINGKVYPNEYSYYLWIDLAKQFKLDSDSIFDAHIWDKLVGWVEKYIQQEGAGPSSE